MRKTCTIQYEDDVSRYAEFDHQNRYTALYSAVSYLVLGYIAKMDDRGSFRKNYGLNQTLYYSSFDEKQRQLALHLFEKGTSPDYHPNSVLQQFSNMFKGDLYTLRSLLVTHAKIAFLDGQISPNHNESLYEIAEILGFSDECMHEIFVDASAQLGYDPLLARSDELKSGFFENLFYFMGKVAGSGGYISIQKIKVLQQALDACPFTLDQRSFAVELFQRGTKLENDRDINLEDFYMKTATSQELHREFLAIQVEIASRDDNISPVDLEVLHQIGDQLHLPESDVESILCDNSKDHSTESMQSKSIDDYYAVLKISSDASNVEVRKTYRKLMSRFHPDKFESKELPDEMIDVATNKTREVRIAYEKICQERGIHY